MSKKIAFVTSAVATASLVLAVGCSSSGGEADQQADPQASAASSEALGGNQCKNWQNMMQQVFPWDCRGNPSSAQETCAMNAGWSCNLQGKGVCNWGVTCYQNPQPPAGNGATWISCAWSCDHN